MVNHETAREPLSLAELEGISCALRDGDLQSAGGTYGNQSKPALVRDTNIEHPGPGIENGARENDSSERQTIYHIG